MFQFEFPYRVRYADTDQMGYMYYGHYAKLYEIGRTEALRSLGFPYKKLEDDGVMMPVYENHSKFLFPALYDDLLTIKVIVNKMPKMRFEFDYEIFDSAGKLLHKGDTTLVFVDMKTNKLMRCPRAIMDVLQPYLTS